MNKKSINNNDPMAQLREKIEHTDPELRLYIEKLEIQNAKLHTSIASLQVDQLNEKNRLHALRKQLEEQAEVIREIGAEKFREISETLKSRMAALDADEDTLNPLH